MIVSHEHKFIFLKTKKTAGTSIELALTELCGSDDVITPLTEIDEAKREGGRCAQNWRLHGWWGSKRPLFKRRWFKFTAADYGFYNHMPAAEARALIDDKCGGAISNSPSTATRGTGRSPSIITATGTRQQPPSFASFMHEDARARIDNYDIYSIDGDVAVDFVGRYESLADDLKLALGSCWLEPRCRAAARQDHVPPQHPALSRLL